MQPFVWPVRLIPKRSPPFLWALAVSAASLAVAFVVRGLALGWENVGGLSSTYFPAFIVATLFAGARWGVAALIAVMVYGIVGGTATAPGVSQTALTIQFGLSAALTVLVSGALRETLVRLDEAYAVQRETQSALDRSEARLRAAQDAGSVGLWDWDVLTGDGHWSPVLYRNLGFPPGENPAAVRSLLDAVHPDDREAVRQVNITAVKEGHMAPIEYRVVWPDGSIHWLLSRGEMMRDEAGRIVRAVGVNIDITEQRLAGEQVRESEQRFRALADSAPILMWVSRSDGAREFVNRTYVDFVGTSYDQALAFDWRSVLHPDDLGRILEEQVAGEASRALFSLEARYRNTSGAYRWIHSISQPRYGPTGDFVGFIGVGFDITESKQVEELLAGRVAAALGERDAVEAQLRQAQKLEAVGQLTGGVAHDFNNLLTVITGALDLMQRHPEDGARRERMIDAALTAARRGERLTHQLLAFARRQALNPELVAVDTLLTESEPLLRRAVGEAANLTVAPGAPGAVARIDPSQFEAAVMNLVLNSRDAVTQGGAIRLETAVVRLGDGEVPETPAGDYVAVVVHDTGSGMDAETVAHVFEPFFTTKEVGKGTGLGLSQVYGFARQSGGGAAVESAPGQGATVRLYLPLSADAAVGAAVASVQPTAARGPALRILLVEDDIEVGDMIAAMLEDLGHLVLRADGVSPAVKTLRRKQAIDLLITDLVMPGDRSGVDLAREAVVIRPGLPVILSSGYTGEALASADDAPWPLLKKPYSADALRRMIDGVMPERAAA